MTQPSPSRKCHRYQNAAVCAPSLFTVREFPPSSALAFPLPSLPPPYFSRSISKLSSDTMLLWPPSLGVFL